MEAAGLIIFRLTVSASSTGQTVSGLQWEILTAAERNYLHKVVLLTVDEFGRPLDKAKYFELRAWLGPKLSIKMLVAGWHSWFLYFDDVGKIHSIDAKSPLRRRHGFRKAIRTLLTICMERGNLDSLALGADVMKGARFARWWGPCVTIMIGWNLL
jgi:hypothetical protein